MQKLFTTHTVTNATLKERVIFATLMSIDLLQLPTKKLLDKIGAGNHKPGSGSAAALDGIISCKLLLTVIELTLDPKRANKYGHCKQEFELIRKDIKEVIGPRLEYLFEEDSNQFDKAIQKRIERDEEKNQKVKNHLQEESLHELVIATEIPIDIAKYCIQLAKYSVVVFEKGFRSARGDGGVGLGNALAGLTGCISIISLNLQSYPRSKWTESMKFQRNQLMVEYNKLQQVNVNQMLHLANEADVKSDFLAKFAEIRKSLHGKTNLKYSEIENLARQIQNALFEYQVLIWGEKAPNDLVGVLQPQKVIELLKYAFKNVITLGVNDRGEEIAGVIDNRNDTISISRQKPEIFNFTAAHELGHALLHDKLELHRDLPLDGSESDKSRPIEEIQADKFAAFFLMPKKLVAQMFVEAFGMKRFVINEETAHLLANISVVELRKTAKTKRELSRMVAKCTYYNFRPFKSLTQIFNVSIEAMAIRLEELQLVEY